MNTKDAALLAHELMLKHLGADTAWAFRFDNAVRTFGTCNYRKQEITLSRKLVSVNNEPQVRDTILHEIAHALTPGAKHGAAWKAACRRLGARPVATVKSDEIETPLGTWVLECPRCHRTVNRYRKPPSNREYGCLPCKKETRRWERLIARRVTGEELAAKPEPIAAPEPKPEPAPARPPLPRGKVEQPSLF